LWAIARKLNQKMLITLTTDFGLKDAYVGILKGLLYSTTPNVNLVDLSHQITPFNIQEAFYVIQSAYSFFPEKTIHLILVDSEVSQYKKPIIMILNNHYFISSENGILSLLANEKQPEIIIEAYFAPNEETTLLFVRIASEIVNGKPILELGKPIEHLKQQNPIKPIISNDNQRITGNIIYIDQYGNAVSNISKKIFQLIGNGRRFEILFRNYRATKIYEKYIDYQTEKNWNSGKHLLLFNSSDLLEIALYRGSPSSGGTATTLLGLEHQSSVIVQFFED